ncbi:hypothetical protein D1AOALGA4SA_5840 [Olavius algarvensis Delta 1 endosymbiont]|nr:hypothetical protein D1AOALGA4SA_5840 [Olavius algarvensis Delta 1 endosymbiont]
MHRIDNKIDIILYKNQHSSIPLFHHSLTIGSCGEKGYIKNDL